MGAQTLDALLKALKGTLLPFTASVADADGDPLTYTLDPGVQEGAVIEPVSGEFAWTPGTEGTFTITIRVSDGESLAGEDSEAIIITVEAETKSFIFLPLVRR